LFGLIISLPNSVFFYLVNDPSVNESIERDTAFWVGFQLMHVVVTVTSHNISIWLTVYLAYYRYIFLMSATPISNTKSGTKQNKDNMMRQRILDLMKRSSSYRCTVISIISLVAFCVMFCVPSYLWPAIRRKEIFSNQTNSTHLIYHISASDLEIASNHTVYNLMFYSQVIWIHTHFIYFLIKFHTSLFLGHICQIYTMFFASHVYFTVDLIIVIYINFFKYFF